MKDTHQTGNKTEAAVLSLLLPLYDVVLIPFGYGQRYDLVVERQGHFLRIQCKTGWLREGCITFKSSSAGEPASRGYKGDADVFAVFCHENGKLYMVPVDEVGESTVTLRLATPKNNQRRGIRLAADYEVQAPVAQW